MINTKAKISINKLNSQHEDFNATLQGLCIQATISGAKVDYSGGFVTYSIDPSNLTMDLCKLLVSLNVEVTSFPFWVKVNPSDSVPEGIPERTLVDEEGATIVKTWEQWKMGHYYFVTMPNEDIYISAQAYADVKVKLNDFSAVFDNCIDVATYKALGDIQQQMARLDDILDNPIIETKKEIKKKAKKAKEIKKKANKPIKIKKIKLPRKKSKIEKALMAPFTFIRNLFKRKKK